MALDQTGFDLIDREYQRLRQQDQKESEQELRDVLNSLHFAPQTTPEQRQAAIEIKTKEFWAKRQPELDERDKARQSVHFVDWGGTREAAQEQVKRQQASEKLNTDWQSETPPKQPPMEQEKGDAGREADQKQRDEAQRIQDQQRREREEQERLRQEKLKKEKAQKDHQDEQQRTQNQQQQQSKDEKDMTNYIRQRRESKTRDHGNDRD